jgi:peptidoglycan hydrolase CwlO-like protein
MKLKTVMSLRKINNVSTYNEGLETVNQVLDTCQKLNDEIPAIKGKIQKVDEVLKESEAFMQAFKEKYTKLKPGIYEQYNP